RASRWANASGAEENAPICTTKPVPAVLAGFAGGGSGLAAGAVAALTGSVLTGSALASGLVSIFGSAGAGLVTAGATGAGAPAVAAASRASTLASTSDRKSVV